MEEKKKSSIGVILLVILLMVACFIGGYYSHSTGLIQIGVDSEDKQDSQEIQKEANSQVVESTKCSVVTIYETTDSKISELIPNMLKDSLMIKRYL